VNISSFVEQKLDALANIFLHKILICIAFKKRFSLLIYLFSWNFLTFNKIGLICCYKFWRNISGYSENKVSRAEMNMFLISKLITSNSRYLLGFMKISTGLGFFQIGSKFNQLFCESLVINFKNRETPYRYIRALQGFLSQGDLDSAAALSQSNSEFLTNHTNRKFFNSVTVFLDVCGISKFNRISSSTNFDFFINNRNIVLLGPAELNIDFKLVRIDDPIVCRRVGIGADQFTQESPNFSNFKVAYSDNFYIENKENLNSWIDSSGIDFLVINRTVENDPRIRTARNFNNLFASGAANKMPLAIYDILLGNPRNLFCDGITFYMSKVAYAVESLDYTADGIRISQNGSGGSKFYVSVALAEHNIFINRLMTRNLSRNSKFMPSEVLSSILNLSEDDFASELDSLYGEQKI
jgi:hypothetical protein